MKKNEIEGQYSLGDLGIDERLVTSSGESQQVPHDKIRKIASSMSDEVLEETISCLITECNNRKADNSTMSALEVKKLFLEYFDEFNKRRTNQQNKNEQIKSYRPTKAVTINEIFMSNIFDENLRDFHYSDSTISVRVSINFDDLLLADVAGRVISFDYMDKAIYNTICTLYYNGNSRLSADMIYRTLVSVELSPTDVMERHILPEELKNIIMQRINKMTSTKVRLEDRQFDVNLSGDVKNDDFLHYGHMLDGVYDQVSFAGGRTALCFSLLAQPALLRYAIRTGSLTTTDINYDSVPLLEDTSVKEVTVEETAVKKSAIKKSTSRKTSKSVMLELFISNKITIAKSRGCKDLTVIIDQIYDICEVDDKKGAYRARTYSVRCLDSLKTKKVIRSYTTIYAEGGYHTVQGYSMELL